MESSAKQQWNAVKSNTDYFENVLPYGKIGKRIHMGRQTYAETIAPVMINNVSEGESPEYFQGLYLAVIMSEARKLPMVMRIKDLPRFHSLAESQNIKRS
ncbi:MAG: hypothetical protein WCK31_02125 [bacterium]